MGGSLGTGKVTKAGCLAFRMEGLPREVKERCLAEVGVSQILSDGRGIRQAERQEKAALEKARPSDLGLGPQGEKKARVGKE